MKSIETRPTCIGTTLCAAALLILGAAPLLARATVSSTFDTSADGWTAAGDFTGAPVTWLATGGNPGGNIEIVDAVLGGTTYFVAPAAFLGNQAAAYGQSLEFDLKQHITGSPNPFNSNDVVLVGGGLTLVLDTPNNPAYDAWTHYSVSLTAGPWHVTSLSGAVATTAQVQTVLGDLTALRIRAEYQTGADTGFLDNAVLHAVPEPATLAMWVAGLGVVGWRLRRRRN